MIEFRVFESESTFLDSRKNYSPSTVLFQVRIDPLTGRTCHFSHFGAIKPQMLDLPAYDRPDVKGFCPFCIDKREMATPKFTPDIIPEGRMSRGEACLIPNLFPYDIHSGVVIMTDDHVVGISGFTKKRLVDSFSLGTEFLRRIASADTSLFYHVMAWNYMPPSGGGLVHPHQQYFATSFPGNQFIDEFSASARHLALYGRNFWHALIEEEVSREERYIAAIGKTHWIVPFTSLGSLGDVMCIFPYVHSINDFSEDYLMDLTQGLEKLFRAYEDAGIYSFNASLSFGPSGQGHFSSCFRIVPRTFLNMRDFATDLNFFQAILSEPICTVLPENLCEELRPYFR
jgi:UDPglucose--hexose-1-phosphate uridylyltransferase